MDSIRHRWQLSLYWYNCLSMQQQKTNVTSDTSTCTTLLTDLTYAGQTVTSTFLTAAMARTASSTSSLTSSSTAQHTMLLSWWCLEWRNECSSIQHRTPVCISTIRLVAYNRYIHVTVSMTENRRRLRKKNICNSEGNSLRLYLFMHFVLSCISKSICKDVVLILQWLTWINVVKFLRLK